MSSLYATPGGTHSLLNPSCPRLATGHLCTGQEGHGQGMMVDVVSSASKTPAGLVASGTPCARPRVGVCAGEREASQPVGSRLLVT